MLTPETTPPSIPTKPETAPIQLATGESAQSIDAIARVIDEVNTIATAIAAAVEEQTTVTNEIAMKVQETASATRAVAMSVEKLDGTTFSAAGAAAETDEARRVVAAELERLRSDISDFLAIAASA